MKKKFTKIIAIILSLVACISLYACAGFDGVEYKPTLPNSSIVMDSYKLNVNDDSETRVADRVSAVAKVERSVVAIKMEYEVTDANNNKSTSTSSGSGVIVDNSNPDDNIFYVLTCHHVIDSKGDITVYVPDMNTRNFTDDDYDERFMFKGKIENKITNGEISLIGGDKFSDVAVLKLDVTDSGVNKNQIDSALLPSSSYQMKRGESVFAIGNPSGELPMNVSDGIISYLDRKTTISDVGEMVLTQIDVQINHGSSGGGLFNYYGELVGITNAGSEVYDGVNYAIPYKHTYLSEGGFMDAATQLIGTYYDTFNQKNFGYVSGSWEIGITISAHSEKVKTPEIKEIIKDSNADKAKLQNGDLIKGVSCTDLEYTKSIGSMNDFSSAVSYLRSRLRLGDSFSLEISRGGQPMNITVQLTEQMIFCDTGVRP